MGLTAGASGTLTYQSFCQLEEFKGEVVQQSKWKKKLLMKISFNSHVLRKLCKAERRNYIPEGFLSCCLLCAVDKLLNGKDLKWIYDTALICCFPFSLTLLVFDGGNTGVICDLPAAKLPIKIFCTNTLFVFWDIQVKGETLISIVKSEHYSLC